MVATFALKGAAPGPAELGGGLVHTIDDIGLATHTCLVAESLEHARESTAAWLASGLAAGEQVMYFEDESADAVLERLADDRVPVESAMADGQLVVVPTEGTRASVDIALDQLEDMMTGVIEASAAQGWPGLRMNGEVPPRLLARGGLPRVVEYESIVSRVLHTHPSARLLCIYDQQIFDESAADAVRAVHTSELITPSLYDDHVLRVTAGDVGRLRLAGEVDHSNRTLIRRVLLSTLDYALRSHSAPTDITLDLSSLRFLDVGGAVELVHLAEEFPSTHRLVLTGVRQRLVRVLDRCGAPFAPQLRVEPRLVVGA